MENVKKISDDNIYVIVVFMDYGRIYTSNILTTNSRDKVQKKKKKKILVI